MIRLLLPVPSPAPDSLRVEGERFHYLTHVLRLEPGAGLEVFDGRGTRYQAVVVRREEAFAELTLSNPQTGIGGAPLTLLQGLPKGDKLEWILQKGTELGITRFLPVATVRAVVKLDAARGESKRTRWQKIVEEAARQCGRSDVPEVGLPQDLLQAVRALPPQTTVLVLDEEERSRSLSQAVGEAGERGLALVVGPEGGLDRAEVTALIAAGAVPVTLGARVLRTETASLAAAAVILHLRGELG